MKRCPYCFKPLSEGEHCSCGYDEQKLKAFPEALRVGTIVGAGYQIGGVLGQGGFGITYRGYDLNMQKVVAIKEFFPAGIVTRYNMDSYPSSSPNMFSNSVHTVSMKSSEIFKKSLNLFYREAIALGRLNGLQNVVHAHQIFRENNTAYIVMDFVEGISLKDLVKRNGKIPEKDLIPLMDPVLAALEKVHSAGILHRDIAPDNIMIEDGQPILLDFGAARVEADGHTSSLVVAKRGYSSFEQMCGGEQDQRSDIYAIGATYYYALSGTVPQDSMKRKMKDELVPLKDLVPKISEHVSDAVMKALALDREDRWSDIKNFRNELNHHSKQELPRTPVSNPAELPVVTEEEPGRYESVNQSEGKPAVHKKRNLLPIILPIAAILCGVLGYWIISLYRQNSSIPEPIITESTETKQAVMETQKATETDRSKELKDDKFDVAILTELEIATPISVDIATITPSVTSTPTMTDTSTPTMTDTTTPTITDTATPTITNTATPTITNTATPTITNTATPTITNTATPTITDTATPTITNTAAPTITNTPAPTITDTATPTITNTAAPTVTNTVIPLPTDTSAPIYLKAGDVLTFGHYEQDNDLTNGLEPVEWEVLTVYEDYALLLSKYGLETKAYHDFQEDVTWETSSIRKWLNNEFPNIAFSQSEKEKIAETMNINLDNPEYKTPGGSITGDNVFLLSFSESQQYLPSMKSRIACPSTYAKAKGAYISGETGMWWLRSPASSRSSVTYVNFDGGLENAGISADVAHLIVRPAIWYNISGNASFFIAPSEPTAELTLTPTVTMTPTLTSMPVIFSSPTENSKPTTTPSSGYTSTNAPADEQESILSPENQDETVPYHRKLQLGEIITFGHYEQDNDLKNGPEDIEWQVIAVENKRVMVISKYALDLKPYHDVEHTSSNWSNCSLRKWLNEEFYYDAFTDEEKMSINVSMITTPNNRTYKSMGGSDTEDHIFLLSIDEANQYFESNTERQCEGTDYVKMNEAYISNSSGYSSWWLRSPGGNSFYAANVYFLGGVDLAGQLTNEVSVAVRPAFWLAQ